jgi:hypothetical protein
VLVSIINDKKKKVGKTIGAKVTKWGKKSKYNEDFTFRDEVIIVYQPKVGPLGD